MTIVADASFIEDLRKSKEAVDVATQWLSSMGYPVIVRPTFEAPTPEDKADYADNGDIEIVQRIEVKRWEKETFSSRKDFPYEMLIVDVCHTYDNARPKPYKYIILNREMTCCFVVDCKTRPKWTQRKAFDSVKKRKRNFYYCDPKFCEFIELPKGL